MFGSPDLRQAVVRFVHIIWRYELMILQKAPLLIRSAAQSDAPTLCAWWNDGAVMAHAGFPNGLGTTEEKIAASLSGDTDRARRLIIELDGYPIGEMNYRFEGTSAEIGIKICEAAKQEQGYGRILLSMLIRALFSMGAEKIILDTNLKNTRAQHVYELLGFRKTGIQYDSWRSQTRELQSQVYYELLPADFHDFSK